MAGYRYQYDVYDIKKGKTIMRNVNSGIIEDLIGLPRSKTATYATMEYVYQKKYRIIGKNLIKPVKINRTKEEVELMKEWDRVRFVLNPNARR